MSTSSFSTPLYPIFLSLTGMHCAVAGLGSVGQRKLRGLLACDPATVLVRDIADTPPDAAELLCDPRVHFACRSLTREDISSCSLVFAATNSPAENTRIAALCASYGVWCNCATAPEQGNFHIPAVARRGSLTAALSTGGASPALARQWKSDLEHWLAPRARITTFMKRLRPLLLTLDAGTAQNTQIFRTLAASPLQNWLEVGNMEACYRLLLTELPPALHVHIAELLDDLP